MKNICSQKYIRMSVSLLLLNLPPVIMPLVGLEYLCVCAGTYACVWGIIGDYVYTYVTSYPRGEA